MKNQEPHPQWGSDVIVDLMKRYGFEYAALNPGSSFRGLHDSMINYGGNAMPEMLLCPHEEVAVQIAHGYAKASGKPMVAVLHDVVGLLHASMAIYYAYIDRAPVFIVGATGPLEEAQRRPRIDWTHTANVQGNAIRDYTKWDDQPSSIGGMPESFARGYQVMMTEPQGPVYMCYDAGLQERKLDGKVEMPSRDCMDVPSPMAADPSALAEAASLLVTAKKPVILADYAGARPGGFEAIVGLAEALGAPVWDVNSRLNFPTNHPLNHTSMSEMFEDADLVLMLDVLDWERATTQLNRTTRKSESRVASDCKWIDIGFGTLGISSWSLDYQRLRPANLHIMADTLLAVPELTRECRSLLERDQAKADRVQSRVQAAGITHARYRSRWRQEATALSDESPLAPAWLAHEIWEEIKDEDWVLTANTLRQWARRLWDFDKPYRHPGKAMGTSTQIGTSIGVALAHKGTGRLVVDIQPDGDLMFDPGALWILAKYEIPMLIVMFNNRAYYNDWEHQILMARLRGTDEGKAHIGMDLFGPEPDFAMLARSMGVWAEGPIANPTDVRASINRAKDVVREGRPALVDVITKHR